MNDVTAASAASPAPVPSSAPTAHPVGHRPRVAVVFGGRSGEHAISCVTAAGVLRALDRDRYDVVPIGITPQGRWVLVPDNPELLDITDGTLPSVGAVAPHGRQVTLSQGIEDRALLPVGPVPAQRSEDAAGDALGTVDVVLPLLHGPYGEDGTVQGLMELAGVPYVGSGVLASAAGMDKHVTKLLLRGQGITVGEWELVTARQWDTDPAAVAERVARLGSPVFVKPARAGSSLGISKVDPADHTALAAAIDVARRHDPRVIVEAMIVGRELECGVLGAPDGGAPWTSVPGEVAVMSGHDFYDFDAKYLAVQDVELTCPADVPAEVADQVRSVAAQVFEAMGCEGLARVDVFLTPSGEIVVNEINTMPGFTSSSMYPRLWEATGMSYPDLLDHLLSLALNRSTGLR